jgi:hypothetical protein
VIGSHAGGFNTGTVGISLIGTYETVAPSAAAREAVAQLAAWRLSAAGKDPASTVRVYSAGSTRFANDLLVTLPRVFGHRDVSATSCPGAKGMSALPAIRSRAAALVAGMPPATELPCRTRRWSRSRAGPARSAAGSDPAARAGPGPRRSSGARVAERPVGAGAGDGQHGDDRPAHGHRRRRGRPGGGLVLPPRRRHLVPPPRGPLLGRRDLPDQLRRQRRLHRLRPVRRPYQSTRHDRGRHAACAGPPSGSAAAGHRPGASRTPAARSQSRSPAPRVPRSTCGSASAAAPGGAGWPRAGWTPPAAG